ncbi:MAG: hypothetical protein COW00_01945 [Bdellovibrio sp. CG12_big_fil_rev_8_21_14_0_65_39_13]|nr:MAG: hypothetical protein COW00_01945 [Bdellovibrio sp. CG12_big_fil_rev_8_21_14_0_65_39_13]
MELRSRQVSRYFHWPQSIKEKCRSHYERGRTIGELQEATGVANNTLRSWVRNKSSSKNFKALKVAPFLEKDSFLLRTPLGFEIRGLSLSQMETFLEKKLL